jgi:signal transduction histidine kinase
MPLSLVLRLAACVGQALLAVVALRATGPLAVPLALLSSDLLVWNFASFAFQASGDALWNTLDTTTSPFTPTFGFEFILVFVGRRRRLGAALSASYAVSIALAAIAVMRSSAILSRFIPSEALWDAVFLGFVLVVVVVATVVLAIHYVEAKNQQERDRTRLLAFALPVAAAVGTTDLVNDVLPWIPPLSQFGTLACAVFMTAAALRSPLFGRRFTNESLLVTPALATCTVAAYFALFRLFSASVAMWLLGTGTLTIALVAVTRAVASQSAAERARVVRAAAVGRLSAQMAHDLKNPLAALQGATQFLNEERQQGRSLDAHAEFLQLIGEQASRMARIVDGYDRIGRVEPVQASLDVALLVREIAAMSAHAAPKITVRTAIDEGLPACRADRDLLARAIENLVRNALEATPDGGTVTLGATRAEDADPSPGVVVTVADTGIGMDARTRERAFDEFFSTKATGSGLGLAFVQRVVESHGGSVTLASTIGRGTVVSLRLPAS